MAGVLGLAALLPLDMNSTCTMTAAINRAINQSIEQSNDRGNTSSTVGCQRRDAHDLERHDDRGLGSMLGALQRRRRLRLQHLALCRGDVLPNLLGIDGRGRVAVSAAVALARRRRGARGGVGARGSGLGGLVLEQRRHLAAGERQRQPPQMAPDATALALVLLSERASERVSHECKRRTVASGSQYLGAGVVHM